MAGPLDGVRVADFTWAGVGGYCGLLWAMLGADVIKIETKVRGGTQRLSNPARRVGVKSNLAEELSRDKRSILLNLKSPVGVDIARRIAGKSHIAAENFRPGVMARLGLGYQDLRRANERIVMVSMSANGQSGPDATLPGYAGIFGALSGISSLIGYPGGAPVELRLPSDMVAGTMGALAGVAALVRQQRTGQGQYVDCANRESLSVLIGEYFLSLGSAFGESGRQGNDVPGRAPYGCYRCADDEAMAGRPAAERERWVAVGVVDDSQWVGLRAALDLPDDADLRDSAGRWARRRELGTEIARIVRPRTVEQVVETLRAHGVPCAPVMRPPDLLADPHLAERQAWDVLERADGVPWISFGAPFRFQHAGRPTPRAASPLGSDSRQVMADLLEIDDEEFDKLVADGAIA
ncbi:MAG TPA: CoA transferase [Pseudonocardiaceae bacterium]|jgi:benzylsuccinate CoA-transferase BbsF subunit